MDGLDRAIDYIEFYKEWWGCLDEVMGEGGIIVDRDSKVLMFWGSDDLVDNSALIPHLINLMKNTIWVGWDVRWAKWVILSMAEYLGLPRSDVGEHYSTPSEETKKCQLEEWLKYENLGDVEEQTIITYRNLEGKFFDYTIRN